MYKMFSILRIWFARLFEIEPVAGQASDPLDRMSPRELADLPVHHPSFDRCLNT